MAVRKGLLLVALLLSPCYSFRPIPRFPCFSSGGSGGRSSSGSQGASSTNDVFMTVSFRFPISHLVHESIQSPHHQNKDNHKEK